MHINLVPNCYLRKQHIL
uniref:Uncharacterized protein n=1 Tax=Arundo donax TaxID=35708 RepID=A0A0A9CDQ6_ARUDO